MIFKSDHGAWPKFHETARVGEDVSLIGEVELGADTGIWYGTVLRGDVGPIYIGDGSNLQDNTTVHCEGGVETRVGNHVTVGHNAVLHSCFIHDHALIGMGAILLNECVIGEGAVVAAGALVPEKMVIPPYSVAMGVPAKVVRPVTEAEKALFGGQNRHYVELAREQLPLVSDLLEKQK